MSSHKSVRIGMKNLERIVKAARGRGWVTAKKLSAHVALSPTVVAKHLSLNADLFESRLYHYAGKEYRLREGL